MKRILLSALLAMGLWTWATVPCMAEPEDAPAQKVKKSKKKGSKAEEEPAELSPVAAALQKVKCYTKSTPALDAKYYIFLYSTSTCFHCNRTMPDDVLYYKEMRRQKDVEMILVTISQLDNPTAAKGFLDKYGAPFPGMLWEDMKAAGVPGSAGMQLPPGFIIVRSDGQVMHSGPGSVNGRNMLQDWKQHTIGADAGIPEPSEGVKRAKDRVNKARAKAKASREQKRAQKKK